MDLIGLAPILDLGGKLIDRLIPDPAAKAAAQLELVKLAQAGDFAVMQANVTLAQGQLDTNKAEAANPNLFVSGWRPFIGWICGSGLGYQFVLAPLMTWGADLAGHPVTAPSLDLGTLSTLLLGMLGLGAMRTAEKLQGKA